MVDKTTRSWSSLLFFFALLLIVSANVAQEPVLDENGQQTGLFNLNPNKSAEPWVAGGLDEMTAAEIAAIPALAMSDAIAQRPLPAKVDNTKNREFRPIFNQKGGSCAQASGIAYTFTYEMNCVRNLASNVTKNQYPYGFTYNFLNRGSSSNGSNYSSGWRIVMETGCPNVVDYGGTLYGGSSGSKWLTGYKPYFNGMANKIKRTFSIKVTTAEGINKLKQWLDDHGGAQSKGGLVCFSAYASQSQLKSLPSGTPQAGKKAIIKWGKSSGGHAMTIGGYDDEIRWDYNGDGQYTNDKDINNDGKVDAKDWEIGAVIMINSWGSRWGNGGKAYMMYWVLANHYSDGGIKSSNNVYGIECYKENTPKVTYKVSMTHSDRSKIRIRAGVANSISATKPSETHSFSSAFNYCGGSHPMQGKNASSTIEIGLDATPLLEEVTGNQAKFFLRIDSKGGTGKVNSFSMIDYSTGTPREIKCDQQNVTIESGSSSSAKTTYLSIVHGTVPVIAQKASHLPNAVFFKENRLFFNVNERGPLSLTLFDLKGKMVKHVAQGVFEQGEQSVSLQNVAGGLYLCRIETAGYKKDISIMVRR